MAIQLTESAVRQIATSLERRGGGVGLRVGVKSVGCSGLAYTFDVADTVGETDLRFDSNGATLVVAREHLRYLDGATLDFVREPMRQYFRFDNPNARNACGCGESFNVEEQAV